MAFQYKIMFDDTGFREKRETSRGKISGWRGVLTNSCKYQFLLFIYLPFTVQTCRANTILRTSIRTMTTGDTWVVWDCVPSTNQVYALTFMHWAQCFFWIT